VKDFSSELVEQVRVLIRDVPDFPKPGITFKDLTPVWQNGAALSALNSGFVDRYRDQRIDAFVGIESRGFICAAPVAAGLQKGLILLRKPGKLPAETVSVRYELEYGSDTLQMHVDAIRPGMRVVVLDDLLATGGTMKAAIELLQGQGAEIVEAGFIVELGFLDGRAKLGSVPCSSLINFA
jgi:adenine phosphoribosyltransferase